MANSNTGSTGQEASLPIPKSRRGLKGYYAEVVREMKKVNWPTKMETHRLTGVVMAITIICITILTVFGYVFSSLLSLLTKGTL